MPPPTTTTTTTSAQSCVYLTVVTELSNGTTVNASTDIWNNQSQSQPITTCVPSNTVETVGVFDSGNYMFSHWLDTGSALRFRTFSISSNTTFVAIYKDINVPTPSTDSVIKVNTILNGSGAPVVGLYSTLWVGNVLNQSCFSPCSFTVGNGQSYVVAVADFGSYAFSHWTDGSTGRFHTVVVSNSSSTIPLTAVYTGTGVVAATAGRLSQELAIQVLPPSMAHHSTPVALVEFGVAFVAVAILALAAFTTLSIRRPRNQQPTR
ncbi:MAG: hypothetical protein JRN46_05880 [Nitrososphaerota archaeon]|nr:hypothetical protein [Nitrososphaerota archaeon]